jgi:hypothetical protein
MPDERSSDEILFDRVQREALQFFVDHCNRDNGLICDSTQPGAPCSIAAVGFALTTYVVATERRWMAREDAIARTLSALRFFHDADLSGAADATGYRGFFFHFLDMSAGRRTWHSELSTIDTALLVAGMLSAAQFFDGDDHDEREIRLLARSIYQRIDWLWACDGRPSICHGWTPERGFLVSRWRGGYSEALLLYVLAIGSPTHPVPAAVYPEWLSGYRWKTVYGRSHVYAGPLFIHQFPHVWVDFRGIVDEYMADRGIDYFENSRRATWVQHEYALRNPRGFTGYQDHCWGMTACDGPGPAELTVTGRRRRFFGYHARGAPFGPDDGTVAPWASIASLPFAPAIVIPTMRLLTESADRDPNGYGVTCSFNFTWPASADGSAWVSPWHFGLNQGPIVLMIENHRSGLVWRLMRSCEPIVNGLRRAGFSGGWLGEASARGDAAAPGYGLARR